MSRFKVFGFKQGFYVVVVGVQSLEFGVEGLYDLGFKVRKISV